MKISVLLENTPCANLTNMLVEHGLSLHIETGGMNILFDMGQSEAIIKNAERLGIDLSRVDIAILSHGHYDHGGGLSSFLKVNSKAPIYVCKSAFSSFFNAKGKYIGLDPSLAENERIIYTNGNMKLDDKVSICNVGISDTDRQNGSFSTFGLTVMRDDKLFDDDFSHEQYLLIEENGKRILFCGCAHKGIAHIAESFKPDILVGGFHLSKAEDPLFLRSIAYRLALLDTRFYTCHCTGATQFAFMKKHIPFLEYIRCGETITL